MTGPEHYAEAERLIREVGPDHSDDALLEIHASIVLARAQVHATLAQAAATADPYGHETRWAEVTR